MGPPLFKYAKRTYAEDVVQHGKVRVGTLAYYRRGEAAGLDPIRADRDEGRVQYAEGQSRPQLGSQLSPFAKRIVRPIPGALYVGCAFSTTHEHPNCLVYCMSHEYSLSAAGTYDGCVRIIYPNDFLHCLTAALLRHIAVTPHEIERVTYTSRVQPGQREGQLHPAFVKPPNPYAVEKEVRAIWLSSVGDLQDHYDVTEPTLTQYVALEELVAAAA